MIFMVTDWQVWTNRFVLREWQMKLIVYPVSIAIALLLSVQTASAKWYEASSENFVIYAEDSESDLREFADNLERFRAALKHLWPGGAKPPPSPSNRVTIFVTKGNNIIKLAGDTTRQVAGFYLPRAGGSIAFTPPVEKSRSSGGGTGSRVSGRKGNAAPPDFTQTVLLHEYGHHYMISTTELSLPLWYSEGFGEYVGATTFPADGSVGLGRPAQHRAAELQLSRQVPWTLLFDTKAYRKYKKKNKGSDAFYGQSWAVFHYLQSSEETQKVQKDYIKRLLSGESDLQAAQGAFGDLNKFGAKVIRYAFGKLHYLSFPPDWLPFKPVTVRELTAGEAVIMPVVMQSRRGVNREQAAKLVVDAREIAAKFPADAAVLAALAEAEFDAGNDDAAIAAADRATAAQPANINALIQKGYALFRKAKDASDKKAAFSAVRKHFSSINQIEKDHPIPLIYFYRAYSEQGSEPTENAKAAIDYALQLSPFDKTLRLNVAQQDMRDKRYAEARRHLWILANDPHRPEPADGAPDPIVRMLKEAEEKLGIAQDADDEETESSGEVAAAATGS